MKLLIVFPNSTDTPTISTAVPILCGIAKNRDWDIRYFDTYPYKKTKDDLEKKDESGGFKSGLNIDFTKKSFQDIPKDLQELINEFSPDLIAVTALSPEYDFLMSFFGTLDTRGAKVVIGGIHATLVPISVAETRMFDIVVVGEGEETFAEILERMENHQPLIDIRGTYYCDKGNGVVKTNERRMLLPPDKLWAIMPEFFFFGEEYFLRPFDGKKIRRNEIEISRGCPYACSYCGNSALKLVNKGLGKYVKARPIESSIAEMVSLVEKYHIDIFSFADECFLSHPVWWIKEFMDAYSKNVGKPYFFMTRSETITEEKVQLLLSYNIPFQVSIGVESGSDRILIDICNRSCTNDQIIRGFKILNKYKIRTNAFFIVGFPFETREDTLETIEICKKIKPSVASVSIFQPYPGQSLTRRCVENNFFDGKTIPGSFTSDSLLEMPEPYLSRKEIKGLWRTFMLYAVLPKKYYDDIKKCEVDYENNKELYKRLIDIRWKKYDYAEKKGDIKLI